MFVRFPLGLSHLFFALLILNIGHLNLYAEKYAGEIYLIGNSVANNGSSNAIPAQLYSPSQYLEFPADISPHKIYGGEIATLPTFASLSQIYNASIAFTLDPNSQVNAFYGIVATPDILERPLLQGTKEERLNNPTLRPGTCEGCNSFRDMVYLTNLNFMHQYNFLLPRSDISYMPIPIQFNIGATSKYFYEELEGGDYIAQNLNLDAGLCLKVFWGYNPINKSSDRNLKLQLNGFELLPTNQRSAFSEAKVDEPIDLRWHLAFSWEEFLPEWQSRLTVGLNQKPEIGKLPAIGLEWGFRDMLFLRAGKDAQSLSAGASFAYRFIALHYAFIHQDLNNTLYQVSLQMHWL